MSHELIEPLSGEEMLRRRKLKYLRNIGVASGLILFGVSLILGFEVNTSFLLLAIVGAFFAFASLTAFFALSRTKAHGMSLPRAAAIMMAGMGLAIMFFPLVTLPVMATTFAVSAVSLSVGAALAIFGGLITAFAIGLHLLHTYLNRAHPESRAGQFYARWQATGRVRFLSACTMIGGVALILGGVIGAAGAALFSVPLAATAVMIGAVAVVAGMVLQIYAMFRPTPTGTRGREAEGLPLTDDTHPTSTGSYNTMTADMNAGATPKVDAEDKAGCCAPLRHKFGGTRSNRDYDDERRDSTPAAAYADPFVTSGASDNMTAKKSAAKEPHYDAARLLP